MANLTIFPFHDLKWNYLSIVCAHEKHTPVLTNWLIPSFTLFRASRGDRRDLRDLSHWQISSTNWRCGIKCRRKRSPYCSLWGKCHCQSESAVRTKRTQQPRLSYIFFLTFTLFASHIFCSLLYLFSITWHHCVALVGVTFWLLLIQMSHALLHKTADCQQTNKQTATFSMNCCTLFSQPVLPDLKWYLLEKKLLVFNYCLRRLFFVGTLWQAIPGFFKYRLQCAADYMFILILVFVLVVMTLLMKKMPAIH